MITEITLPDYSLFEAVGSVILHAEALDVHTALIRDRLPHYGRPVLAMSWPSVPPSTWLIWPARALHRLS